MTRRFAIAYAFVAVASTTLFWLAYTPMQERAIRAEFASKLENRGDMLEAAIEIWASDRIEDAQTIAAYPRVSSVAAGNEADLAHFAEVLAPFAATQEIDEILVYLRDGRMYAKDGFDAAGRAGEPCFVEARRAIATSATHVNFHRHASGDPVVAFVAPVLDRATAAPIAAVILEVSPFRWLYPLLAARPEAAGPSSEALLVDRVEDSARFLAPLEHDPSPPLTLQRSLSSSGLAAESALNGNRVTAGFVDYRDVPVFAATRRIKRTPWAIVVKVDESDIARQLRRRLLYDGAVAATSLIALGALMFATISIRERQTRRVNERLAAVLNNANDAILFLDRNGRIEEVNRGAEKMYGWSRDELLTMTLAQLVDTTKEISTDVELAKVESSGVRTYRARHHTALGKSFPVELSSRYVNSEGMHGFIAVIRDVSAVIAAEAEVRRLADELDRRVTERTSQLADANRELESFSYSVSHDLRAPLRAIDGFSRLLLEEHSAALDDEGQRLLGVVRGSAQRMGRLIDDLLEFSRAGRRDIRKSPADMNAIVKAVASELSAANAADRPDIRIDDLPSASCDAPLIRQVWTNLLANAVKFSVSKPAAIIEVGARREEGRTVYFVRDHGVGFDMKYAAKLFGVFQRLHAQRDFEGTGVGLALVQRIVRRHGGEVWAESAADRGATFYFSLPDAES